MTAAGPASARLTVHLMGGLGNQLFQYAFGRNLAMANNAQLVLDATGYHAQKSTDSRSGFRELGLQHFKIVGEILVRSELTDGGGLAFRRRARKTLRLFRHWVDLARPYYARREIVEPRARAACFDARVVARRFSGDVSARGFWQSEKYFAAIADRVRHELEWSSPLTAEAKALSDQMLAVPSVGVHVRHGDNATTIAAAMGVLGPEYYSTAIRALEGEIVGPEYFVFSDDIEWAKAILPPKKSMRFVERKGATDGQEDLRLMAKCKHHVLANSTFGWWGAWLGKKDGQIVYAPRRYWQNINRPNPDLYPDWWRLI